MKALSMKITKLKIKNYKSFWSEQSITLSDGFNIIIGENNSGKSSLLDALTPQRLENQPHISIKTKPYSTYQVNGCSNVELELEIPTASVDLYLGTPLNIPLDVDTAGRMTAAHVWNAIKANPTQKVRISREPGRFEKFEHYLYSWTDGRRKDATLWYGIKTPSISDVDAPNISNFSGENQSAGHIASVSKFIYRFSAERLNIVRSGMAASHELESNASNLPSCINWLQSNRPIAHKKYDQLVNRVFPLVHSVRAAPYASNSGVVEIRIWTLADTDRPDLSQPLDKMGTGLGQVLAILYIAITAEHPTVIAIDEPNSFLHPRATRTLFKILNELPIKHQYIVTTHSPEVLRSVEPSTITLVINSEGESLVENLDPSNFQDVQRGLLSIGTRLSDVFSASAILWVEGQTEEICIPIVISKLLGRTLADLDILRVRATGDFESRKIDPKFVFDVYSRLSSSGSLLPKSVGFIFDKETRSDKVIKDLVRQSAGQIFFLTRRTYENYLLDVDAITNGLHALGEIVQGTQVDAWVKKNKNKYEIISEDESPFTDKNWCEKVNAPKLLNDLYVELTEGRHEYRKVRDSKTITEILIQTNPDKFTELTKLLAAVLNQYERAQA